ncbi:site-specific recombinase XerD [Sinorhizobium terangae]|uniref:Tyrosine-type recombinase/integrase n=1 Tax=Sinorhizobium terangae TaxID=110322 RepID=A0A6N7LT87_SINTE|nr:site-specific integrase [Sinorhizobium terangae]MBB4189825.1 site-specific recombinase XerD [Sinorhizobium terangae]MQX15822.1 tyrosine-type recombinase/integrase [Sinorhizobium terangae]MQX16612.1 tyrosine-type recombinase/integrase [Sinorhizobium terangae]MQX19264.1 tyrosine-type recombinase/integrase [Sinorhizobium terangae]
MKYRINDQFALSRPPEGPVASYIISFAEWLVGRGYSLVSTRNQVLMAAGFSSWLWQNRIALAGISGEHPGRYLRERAQFRRPKRGDDAALRHLLDFLRSVGAMPEEVKDEYQPSPIELHVQAYESYLRDARALNRKTIVNYRPVVRDFLNFCFSDGAVLLAELRAVDVTDFVQKRTSRLNIRRAKIMTTALRSFLSYARYNGDITSDLAAAVPIVANWRLSSIPRAISRDDVTRLLASIDRQTPMGRRDYAMILMLARLGLRSSEVITLDLDDIDWVAGQIRVRGKSSQRNDLPLSADVGEAIADYLRNGRPRSACRRVFLRDKAPIRGFEGPSGFGCVIRRCLRRADINAPTTGAHQFRHGLASEMLRGGASLGEIGEVLGHRHMETTAIYAKVDLNALRTLAVAWPGEVQ